jgi:hypothetical protein
MNKACFLVKLRLIFEPVKVFPKMTKLVLAPDDGIVVSWNKRLKGRFLKTNSLLGTFRKKSDGKEVKLKAPDGGGFVSAIAIDPDCPVSGGDELLCLKLGILIELNIEKTKIKIVFKMLLWSFAEPCAHEVVMTDTTNGFGPKKTLADLPMHANVQAVHSLPELRISESEAQRAAHEEIQRLHDNRKLVLLVDLDQTVIHTTQNRPKKLTKNTISFQLTRQDPWLWTRLR